MNWSMFNQLCQYLLLFFCNVDSYIEQVFLAVVTMTAASIPLHENWSLYFCLAIQNDNVYCKLVTPESLIHFAETWSSIYSMSRTEVSLTIVCTVFSYAPDVL